VPRLTKKKRREKKIGIVQQKPKSETQQEEPLAKKGP